jgi:hypothetical protein
MAMMELLLDAELVASTTQTTPMQATTNQSTVASATAAAAAVTVSSSSVSSSGYASERESESALNASPTSTTASTTTTTTAAAADVAVPNHDTPLDKQPKPTSTAPAICDSAILATQIPQETTDYYNHPPTARSSSATSNAAPNTLAVSMPYPTYSPLPATSYHAPSYTSSASAFDSTASSSAAAAAAAHPEDGDEPPSRILHFRNIISSINKNDLITLCSQFGKVNHVVLMRSNNQALVEMCDINSAVHFIRFYSQTPCQVRGRRLSARFSRHQELRRRVCCCWWWWWWWWWLIE